MLLPHRISNLQSVLSVGLMLLVAGAVASEPEERLGKADAERNRIFGQVVLADGMPTSHAKLHVHMSGPSDIDATITTDAEGQFDFIVRILPSALAQLQFTATSQDEQQLAFHRFAWEQSERVTEGIEIRLEPQRTVEVEVVDQQHSAVEDAHVALQLGWPHVLAGFAADASGRVSLSLPASERIESVVAWKDNLGLDYRLYAIPRNQLSDVKAVPPEFPSDRSERLVLEGARPLTVQVTNTEGEPIENRDFQLRTPTRVHGRLLNERTQEPIPNERVIVYQYGIGLYEMPEVELPNPESERYSVQPIEQYYATTDELGQFEFSLGDGEFDLRPPQQEKAEKFTITGQPDIELDVSTKIQPEVELLGIVIDRETSQPVTGARVSGVPRSLRGRDWQATTDEDGKFKVRRREEETYAHAVNADRSQAAIIEIGDTKKTFVIQLEPVGVARGRLLDDALGRAKEEGKRVIVQETATWCGPCHMLSRLLDANRVWEQDYIWVKMDHRWTGAKEIMAELRDGAEGGIPWFAILDASGEKLITSNAPESGQVHFAHMLNTTRQRMTEADVQSLIDAIDKAK